MKKIMMILAALVLLLSAAYAEENDLLARIRQKGEIVVATEGAWAPWTYHDENDQLVGFDVEVAQGVAAKLGVAFSTLNRWENGKSSPRGQAKDAIAALLEEVQGADEEQPGAGTRRRRAVRENYLSTKSMEQMLWAAACSIRSHTRPR